MPTMASSARNPTSEQMTVKLTTKRLEIGIVYAVLPPKRRPTVLPISIATRRGASSKSGVPTLPQPADYLIKSALRGRQPSRRLHAAPRSREYRCRLRGSSVRDGPNGYFFPITTISLRRTPIAVASSFRRSLTTSLSGARAANRLRGERNRIRYQMRTGEHRRHTTGKTVQPTRLPGPEFARDAASPSSGDCWPGSARARRAGRRSGRASPWR